MLMKRLFAPLLTALTAAALLLTPAIADAKPARHQHSAVHSTHHAGHHGSRHRTHHRHHRHHGARHGHASHGHHGHR